MGFFDSLFTNKDSKNAAAAANQGLSNAYNEASQSINGGVKTYNNFANQAGAKFDPFYNNGVNANNMYANALGLNGLGGNTAATNAFQAGPGYQFQQQQGLQALDRGAASRGMLSSGNLLMGEQKYGSDLANQEYQNWLKNLLLSSASGQTAAGSQANILTGQGNTAYDAGKTIGNLAWNKETGIGNNNAAAELANQKAAQNIFGAITSGLNLAGSVIGAGGGGGMFSGLTGGITGAGAHTPGGFSPAFPMPLG